MKKFLIFIGGFVAGILATIFTTYVIAIANKPNDYGLIGLTIFEEKGECMTANEIEILQVLEPDMALALARTFKYGMHGREGSDEIVVLIIDYYGKTFYDEQKIEIPKDKCARQIGTYQYTTKRDDFRKYQYTTKRDDFGKTVPAISIE